MTEIIASRSFRGLATPDAIEAVHDDLDAVWADAPFVPAMDQMVFTTAVIETASNVVQHGRPAADVPVELGVDLTVSLRRLKAKVIAYNAVEPIVPLDDPSLPADDEESGRGLALIKALVTTLTFERHDETNTWILSKDSSPE
jgi:serine/threonine-protein kinase RsbW